MFWECVMLKYRNKKGNKKMSQEKEDSTKHKKKTSSSTLLDEEWRKLLKPAPTKEQVLKILHTSYTTNNHKDNHTVQVIKQLDSYDDVNYMIQMNETLYLLKIHNGVESRELLNVMQSDLVNDGDFDYYKKGHMNSAIHLQNAIMTLLNNNSDGDGIVKTSQPIPPTATTSSTSSSRPSPPIPLSIHSLPVVSNDHSPQNLVVRLLSWIPGRTKSSITTIPIELLAHAGRYLGQIDCILDTFNTKTGVVDDDVDETIKQHVVDDSLWIPARRFHAWDGKNTLELRNFIHYIKNDTRRAMITSVINTFEHDIIKSGVAQQLRKGLNHGDYNDANIIIHNDNDNFKIAGVLDFGDSVESWRVLEITTAMAYAMLSSYAKSNRASISAAAAMLRGYNSVYPLTTLERQHLVLLMTCRLACSATLGAYTFSQNPNNTYLLLHSEPAWKALEMIWCSSSGSGGNLDALDNDKRRLQMKAAMNRVFDQACLYSESTREDGQVIPCFDLICPDPHVVDLLSLVRVSTTDSIATSSSTTEPLAKKQKTTIDNNNDNGNNLPVVTFVTGNAKKLEEVKRILQTTNGDIDSHHDASTTRLPIHLVNKSLDLPELQGHDVLAIAREKCLVASQKVNGGSAVIIEDTSLCFNALHGLPGPYIKWFLDSCGHDGLNRMLAGFDDKTAYAQTVVAYCPATTKTITTNPDGTTTTTTAAAADPVIFSGITNGIIVPARGKLDFGWDPIFEPFESVGQGSNGSEDGNKKTYAEMTKDEKDSISHRSRAFAQLREYLLHVYSDSDNNNNKN